jgi:hypothetical protein
MKAFEKWNKESIKDVGHPYRSMYTHLHKVGWMAALNFIHSQLGYSADDKRIADIIEEEIKDD